MLHKSSVPKKTFGEDLINGSKTIQTRDNFNDRGLVIFTQSYVKGECCSSVQKLKSTRPIRSLANVSSSSSINNSDNDAPSAVNQLAQSNAKGLRFFSPKSKNDIDTRASLLLQTQSYESPHKQAKANTQLRQSGSNIVPRYKTPKAIRSAFQDMKGRDVTLSAGLSSHFKARRNANEGLKQQIDTKFRSHYVSQASEGNHIDLDLIIENKMQAYSSILSLPMETYRHNYGEFKKLYVQRKSAKKDLIDVTKDTQNLLAVGSYLQTNLTLQ